MVDKKSYNYIHPFTHKNILEAWKELLKDYKESIITSDYAKSVELENKMTGLVSALAIKAE